MTKKYALAFVVIFLVCEFAQAQSFYRRNRKTGYQIGLSLGVASYHGDLTDPRLNFSDPGLSVGGDIQLPIEGRLSFRGNLMWYRISAKSDKEFESDGSINTRNLSFRSDNIEASAMGIFRLTPSSPRARTNWTSYLMGGIGATFFNPQAELDGTFHKLQPLQTEGEDYGKVAVVFPAGAGINYRANYDWSFALEASYRFTTTDYLDDVSTTYIDNNSFSDPIARQLADRGPEIGAALREAGEQRGDPDENDGYFIVQLKLYHHFNQGMYYKRKRRKPSKVFRRR
ncbi:MAG: hypothetical protein DHS20C17_20240 [Cyclobacteriaceae bacterium]|nr:MAG: hypothetical protein DHS20C17_20240 [Cyclobacteriaceae bacterium]